MPPQSTRLRGGGCCASCPARDDDAHVELVVNDAASPPPSEKGRPQQLSAEQQAGELLAQLQADAVAPCTLPVVPHDERLRSGHRGVGRPLLRALRAFYSARDALGKPMADVSKQADFDSSMCALTASTGLSLAESVALVGARAKVDTAALVGPAAAFFSCALPGELHPSASPVFPAHCPATTSDRVAAVSVPGAGLQIQLDRDHTRRHA